VCYEVKENNSLFQYFDVLMLQYLYILTLKYFDTMISHNEGTFISSFQRKTDHTGSRGRLYNELHPRPPFTQSRNATMNQARQIRAGTCDTKDAHINAEKTKEAWPSNRTWRLDTSSSSTEEKNWFLRFSHN
jgi:hypothetical protein